MLDGHALSLPAYPGSRSGRCVAGRPCFGR